MQPPSTMGCHSFSVGMQVKQPARIPQAAHRITIRDTILTAYFMVLTGKSLRYNIRMDSLMLAMQPV